MTDVSSAINNTVSISQFHKGMAAKIFSDVRKTGAKVVIKNNEPECVIMSPKDYTEMVDELADLQLQLLAFERIAGGALEHTVAQEEVDRMFGFKPEDLADAEEVEIA